MVPPNIERIRAERKAKIDALGPEPAWWRFVERRRWQAAVRSAQTATLDEFDYEFSKLADEIADMSKQESPMLSMFRGQR